MNINLRKQMREKSKRTGSAQATLAHRHLTFGFWGNVAKFLPPKDKLHIPCLNKRIKSLTERATRSSAYATYTYYPVAAEKQRLKFLAIAIRRGDKKTFFSLEPTLEELFEKDPIVQRYGKPIWSRQWNRHLLELICSLNANWLNDLYTTVVRPKFTNNESTTLDPNKKVAGWTIFHWLAACDQLTTLQSLLADNHAKNRIVSTTTNTGATPLYIAAKYGHSAVVSLLLAANADVDAACDHNHKGSLRFSGATPLFAAAECGSSPTITQLLTAGAKINLEIQYHGSALHTAAYYGYTHIVAQLLAAGINVNIEEYNRQTALFVAAKRGHKEVVAQLLAAGATIDDPHPFRRSTIIGAANPPHRESPLIGAAESGHSDIIEQLLNAGADVNATNSFGDTALYLAARNGHMEVTVQLLAADAYIDDGEGILGNPREIAKHRGQHLIVELIESHQAIMKDRFCKIL